MMQVKMISSSTVPGGKAYALCDEDGNIIAHQKGVTIASEVGQLPTVTVVFLIDGKHIRFSEEPE